MSKIEDALARMSEEELLDLLAELQLMDDFPAYAETHLKVQTIRGRIDPFRLNNPQYILHRIVEEKIRPHRLVRIVALKARRMGFSTYFSGRFYRETSSKANKYAVQITHESDATDTLFKMVKRFYNFSPAASRPSILYNNARLLEFNTPDGKGLNSGFRVTTAGKEDYGSGQLVHFAHFSEVAKWPNPATTDSLLTSVLQCVPDDPDTAVVFESTAKGIGGEFYDRFYGARYRVWVKRLAVKGDVTSAVIDETVNEDSPEDNTYTSIFLPWFVFEEYKSTPPQNFKLVSNEEDPKYCEVTIQRLYNLSDDQMYWRRQTIANKCRGSVEQFMQEYPATPEEAFLGTGRPVFDNHKLMELREACPNPVARYDLQFGTLAWISRSQGALRVWEEPKPNGRYIMSGDPAEGLVDGDFSSADVIDFHSGEQVAQWHGKCKPYEFEQILASLGRRYNNAYLAVERNNHGQAINENLYNNGYKPLHWETLQDGSPGKARKRIGWVSSHTSRPKIIDNLIEETSEGFSGIKCKETCDEMMTFQIQEDGKMEANQGKHDDRVMSFAIAKYIRKEKRKKVQDAFDEMEAIPKSRYKDERPVNNVRTTSRKVDKKGWT